MRELAAPIVLRDFYIERLSNTSASVLAPALAGLGETGMPADVDLLVNFLDAAQPRVQRAALRASARLDVTRAITLALAAMTDATPSLRRAAVDILTDHSQRVDFSSVRTCVLDVEDAATRKKLLRLVKEASKWDAAALLLEMLGDPDEEVRKTASAFLDGWVADFNRNQAQPTAAHLARIRSLLEAHGSRIDEATASLLRFSLRAAEN